MPELINMDILDQTLQKAGDSVHLPPEVESTFCSVLLGLASIFDDNYNCALSSDVQGLEAVIGWDGKPMIREGVDSVKSPRAMQNTAYQKGELVLYILHLIGRHDLAQAITRAKKQRWPLVKAASLKVATGEAEMTPPEIVRATDALWQMIDMASFETQEL